MFQVGRLLPLLDFFLALGMLLSLETQLRAADAALGPGELCLAIWIAPLLAASLWHFNWNTPRVFSELVVFWMVFAMAECIGAVAGFMMSDIRDDMLALHDVIAYTLVCLVSCLLTIHPDSAVRCRRIAWMLVILGAVSLAMQYLNAEGVFSLPSIDPWYWDRLRGWSANPNQLALLCILIAMISLHLAETSKGVSSRISAIVCLGIAAAVGMMAKSNAYSIVVILAVGFFGTFKAWRRVKPRGHMRSSPWLQFSLQ